MSPQKCMLARNVNNMSPQKGVYRQQFVYKAGLRMHNHNENANDQQQFHLKSRIYTLTHQLVENVSNHHDDLEDLLIA